MRYPTGTCSYVNSFGQRPWCAIENQMENSEISLAGAAGEVNWDKCSCGGGAI